MTVRALERAREAGAETVAVTGFPDSPAARTAAHVLSTGYEQELSWAHTVSYTSALAALAFVANSLAGEEERLDLTPLPQVMAEALQLEELAHRLAGSTLTVERFREPPPIVLVGAGPNAATAQEGALKLIETSFVAATAYQLEESLHGPLAGVTQETLVIMLAPPGPSVGRAADLVRALRELEVVPVVLTGEETANEFEEAHRLLLPEVPEILSPLPYVVPLQLFSYYLAVGKGINPDLLHRDDERYRAARAQYE
jgi:glucosamine--fructose-6-phosphate aminotransferase (isomerizing)